MSIEQAKFLEGWLVAKDAPPRVMEAISAVIATLRPGERSALPTFIPQFSIAPSGRIKTPADAPPATPQPAADRIEPEETAPVADDLPPPKQRKGWSPEARAAQAERMRATQARRKEAKNDQPGNFPAPSAGGA